MFGKGGGGDWLSVSVKKLYHDIKYNPKRIIFCMTCNVEACSTERALVSVAKIPYIRNTNFGECSQALALLNPHQVSLKH